MTFKIPEDLTGKTLEELRSLLTEARTAGRELAESPDAKAEDLEALMDFIRTTVPAQIAEVEAADARLEEAKAVFEEPAEEPVAEEPAEEPVEEPVEEPAEEPAPEAAVELEPVAAAAVRPAAQRLANKAPKPKPIELPEISITASADVPGVTTGGALKDLHEVGQAVIKKMQAMGTGRRGGREGVFSRHGIAHFALPRTDGLSQDNPEYKGDDMALLAAASKEARLQGGSLVAAGGWCAPSETMYGMCSIESTDGILDLPSIQVTRGSIRFTKGPTFQDFYTDPNLGWDYTEQQVIDDTEKPFMEIACPDFDEATLRAVGLGLKVPLLTNATYPELVQRYMEGIVIAHQHKVARSNYATIAAGSAAYTAEGAITVNDSLAVLELVAEYQRQQWRMAFNQTLEVLLPQWMKVAFRADIARRNGADINAISDEQVNAFFTQRKMAPQWLYNTGQDIINSGPGNLSIPDVISVPMYPAGTWVKGTKDVISLDTIYDSTDLKVNTYTGMFVEEGQFVVNTCFDSVKVTIPTSISGRTGAADLENNLLESSSL